MLGTKRRPRANDSTGSSKEHFQECPGHNIGRGQLGLSVLLYQRMCTKMTVIQDLGWKRKTMKLLLTRKILHSYSLTAPVWLNDRHHDYSLRRTCWRTVHCFTRFFFPTLFFVGICLWNFLLWDLYVIQESIRPKTLKPGCKHQGFYRISEHGFP